MVDKSTLDSCLTGISFPADSDVILDCASGNDCPSDVTAQLRSMPSHTFRSEEEMLCRLGNSSYCV